MGRLTEIRMFVLRDCTRPGWNPTSTGKRALTWLVANGYVVGTVPNPTAAQRWAYTDSGRLALSESKEAGTNDL